MDEEGEKVAILIRRIQLEVNKQRYDHAVKAMFELHDLTEHLKKGPTLRAFQEWVKVDALVSRALGKIH